MQNIRSGNYCRPECPAMGAGVRFHGHQWREQAIALSENLPTFASECKWGFYNSSLNGSPQTVFESAIYRTHTLCRRRLLEMKPLQ
jgi:hypothetical protein